MGDLINEILNSITIGLDTETTGTYYPRDRAFNVAISTQWADYSIDFRHEAEFADKVFRAIDRRRPIIAAHNASFDYKMLDAAGYPTPLECYRCTVVRACLINEHESSMFPWTRTRGSYSLDDLCQKYLGERKDETFIEEAAAYLGIKPTKNRVMARIAELPPELVKRYAAKDSRLALRLYHWQEQEIEKQGLQKIVDFEQKVFPVIVRSEMKGIDVDLDTTHRAVDKLTGEIDKAQKKLNNDAGKDVNVNSSPQVKELFKPEKRDGAWFAVDGTPLESTKSGNPSFGGEALHNMTHPLAEQIINVRSLIKTRDTFLKSHIIGHEYNGKVYPNINQTKGEDGGTGTGRLSYTEPAMQQIPSRNKRVAEIVKPCFIPPAEALWVETDLASFEVRVFAHLVAAYNDSLVQAYAANPGLDFHQWVGDMTNLPRNATYSGEPNAKQLNLSMIFNQGRGATAAKMGMPWEWSEFTDNQGKIVRYQKAGREAHAVIDKYHSRVQGVKTLADRAKLHAESSGQIQTAFGRRLRFPSGYKSYKASGILIQSTSADINKRNWLVIDEAIGNDGHLILNTHDSYSMAMYGDWQRVLKRVKEAIEDMSDINFRVPLLLDVDGAGKNWWSAKCGELQCS